MVININKSVEDIETSSAAEDIDDRIQAIGLGQHHYQGRILHPGDKGQNWQRKAGIHKKDLY